MSALYVVSTPIGNLEDITYRAVRILGEVDLIAAEDTRHTRKLLDAYDIRTPTTSLHSHNEAGKSNSLLRRIEDGEDVALVSDGGTPGISDPGGRLIRAAIDRGIRVVPAPGPCACVAAASVAGLPTAAFYYAGFCSPKSGRRRRRMESLRDLENETLLLRSQRFQLTGNGSLEGVRPEEMHKAMTESPLRTIEWVVMNDRPYTDILQVDFQVGDAQAVWCGRASPSGTPRVPRSNLCAT